MADPKISTPVVHVVAGVLFDRNANAVLMAQRAAHKSHPGEWEFPGGKMEQGETPECALCRELQEELGIDVETGAMEPAGFASYAYPERHVILLLYLIRDWQGAPQALDHAALQWVTLEDLPDFAVLPADRPLIDALICYFKNNA